MIFVTVDHLHQIGNPLPARDQALHAVGHSPLLADTSPLQ